MTSKTPSFFQSSRMFVPFSRLLPSKNSLNLVSVPNSPVIRRRGVKASSIACNQQNISKHKPMCTTKQTLLSIGWALCTVQQEDRRRHNKGSALLTGSVWDITLTCGFDQTYDNRVSSPAPAGKDECKTACPNWSLSSKFQNKYCLQARCK